MIPTVQTRIKLLRQELPSLRGVHEQGQRDIETLKTDLCEKTARLKQARDTEAQLRALVASADSAAAAVRQQLAAVQTKVRFPSDEQHQYRTLMEHNKEQLRRR